jgi:hypothetical protein
MGHSTAIRTASPADYPGPLMADPRTIGKWVARNLPPLRHGAVINHYATRWTQQLPISWLGISPHADPVRVGPEYSCSRRSAGRPPRQATKDTVVRQAIKPA